MSTKKIISPILAVFLFSLFYQISFAQTATELEKQEIKKLIKNKESEDRTAKIQAMTPPKSSGITSVDNLATSVAAFLVSTNDNSKVIGNLYKRTLGETVDGVQDVTEKKPTLQELVAFSENLTTQIAAVKVASEAVPAASDEVSKASPLKAPKASKALSFAKDGLALVTPELNGNLAAVKSLIEFVKTRKNY